MDTIITTQEHIRTVTQKGQVTIPKQVRQMLEIEPNDKVVFETKNGRVEIRPAAMTLETTYGAVNSLSHPLSLKTIKTIIAEERAEKYKK